MHSKLENYHAVREGELGLSLPWVACREKERSTRLIFEARGEILPREPPSGGEAVHGRIGLGGTAVIASSLKVDQVDKSPSLFLSSGPCQRI